MSSVRRFRTLFTLLCLLALATFALVGCGGGDVMTTMLTQVSTPPTMDLPEVQVPDIAGMDLIDAKAALLAAGLNKVGEHYPVLNCPQGMPVVSQSPAGGTWVPLFSTVEYAFSSPGDYLPDVVGMAEYDAHYLLGNWAWNSSAVYATTPLSDWWGIVMAQTPAPGTLWAIHPPVTLVVGQAPEPVTTLSLPEHKPLFTTTTALPSRGSPTTTTTLPSRGS